MLQSLPVCMEMMGTTGVFRFVGRGVRMDICWILSRVNYEARPGQAASRQGYICPKHCVQNIVSSTFVQLFTSISYFYFLIFFDNFGYQIFIGASEKNRYQNCCHLNQLVYTHISLLMSDTQKSNSTSRVHAHGSTCWLIRAVYRNSAYKLSSLC